MTSRIQELQAKIDQADVAYYTHGKSVVEDALYDQWKAELEKINPQDVRITRVGSRIQETILQKRKHRIPMGSQFKATNEDEYRKWVEGIGDQKVYHASYKMDGGSFSFEYQDGRFFWSVPRRRHRRRGYYGECGPLSRPPACLQIAQWNPIHRFYAGRGCP